MLRNKRSMFGLRIAFLGFFALTAGTRAVDPPPTRSDPARLARIRAAQMPMISQPVAFDTSEADAILSALEVFPPDNAFNQLIDEWPLHPNSKSIVASMGSDKPFRYNPDMGFVIVPPDQPRVAVTLVEYPGESDAGPFPVPRNIPIEGWPAFYQRGNETPPTLETVQRRPTKYEGDRHAIVIDPVNRLLYEFFTFGKTTEGWAAGQASIFDLKTNTLRPDGWTSADAAGLPILPGLARYEEVQVGAILHALRFTAPRTCSNHIYPARHDAGSYSCTTYPPMGLRVRLKASVDISGFGPQAQVILLALKRYGMLLADNGSPWYVTGAPSASWNDDDLHGLQALQGSDFEAVDTTNFR